jgi:uncharacterized protein (DUF305 family)
MTRRLVLVSVVLALTLPAALAAWPGTTGWAQTGGSDRSGQGGPGGQMMVPLDQLSGDDFDKAFLAEMSLHHAMAIPMSRPVVTNAAHQEVKDLAQGIISTQTAEIQQMGDWAKAWYGLELPTMVDMMLQSNPAPTSTGGSGGMMGHQDGMGNSQGMPGMPMGGPGMPMSQQPGGMMGGQGTDMGMSMMTSLWQLPPNRLEAVFLSQMIPHHQSALDMAQLVPTRAAHQELKDLAQRITSSQSAEISQMNAWLAAWYSL